MSTDAPAGATVASAVSYVLNGTYIAAAGTGTGVSENLNEQEQPNGTYTLPSEKKFLISKLDVNNNDTAENPADDTYAFNNYVKYGANAAQLSNYVGITAVRLAVTVTYAQASDSVLYDFKVGVNYNGSSTVKYYSDLTGSATPFNAQAGVEEVIGTTERGTTQTFAIWIFIDGTTSEEAPTATSFAITWSVAVHQ